MKQSLRTGGKQTEQLLENLCKILHFQHEADKSTSPSSQDQLKIVSKFCRVIDEVVPDLLPLLVRTKLIPKVLKILYFLQFPSTEMSVALMHKAVQVLETRQDRSQHVSKTVFSFKGPQPLQWGSEFQTSLDYEWSKRGWVANGYDFEWDLKSGSPTI